jgi:hypothetical protein
MSTPDPNERLSRTLAAWRVQPSVNPEFRPAVWQRIRQAGGDTLAGYLRAHAAAWSVAAVLAITATGLGGVTAARARLDAKRDAMVVAYLVDLDPRVQARLRP